MELGFIEELKADSYFAMVSGSKEGFHSNVLAWGFEKSMTDKNFDNLKELFGIHSGKEILAVSREKENFDVLVLYGSFEKPELLLIVNKFKAIPEKKQFMGYSDKLKKGFDISLPESDGKNRIVKTKNAICITKFVLAAELTLDHFYEQIKDDGWQKVTYEDYLECMENIRSENEDDGLTISRYVKMTDKIIDGIINPILLEKESNLKAFPDENIVNKLSEIQMHDLYLRMWYSKALFIINKSVHENNYDDCAAELTLSQGVLSWSKTIVCDDGKLSAGVQIQSRSFRITVEPYKDFGSKKEIYCFKDLNNSSQISIKVAEWENKILEEVSRQFDFFINENSSLKPCNYNDFIFIKCDIREDTSLSELAESVDVALDLIIKNSKVLSCLGKVLAM